MASSNVASHNARLRRKDSISRLGFYGGEFDYMEISRRHMPPFSPLANYHKRKAVPTAVLAPPSANMLVQALPIIYYLMNPNAAVWDVCVKARSSPKPQTHRTRAGQRHRSKKHRSNRKLNA